MKFVKSTNGAGGIELPGKVLRVGFILFVVIAGGLCAFAAERADDALAYGPYSIGVKFEYLADPVRTVPATGAARPRPIRITIWYPAAGEPSQPSLTVADYLAGNASEFDESKKSAAGGKAALDKFREMLKGAGADVENLDKVFSTRMRAVADAQPADGKFPLLVYAPSFGESPSENIVLCEFLASHGYVVASCPSAGPDGREMVHGREGIMAQAADLAFVFGQMEKFEPADCSNAATFGYSWGGLANVLFAVGESRMKAIASLDGSIAIPRHQELVSSIPALNPANLRAPFIYLASFPGRFKTDPHDYSFIEAATNADRYLLTLHGLGHGNFSSMWVAVLPCLPGEATGGVAPERAQAGYRAVCFYLLQFFDAWLKGDADAAEALAQAPAENSFDADLVSISRW